jgi:hypothetical protein
MAIGQARCLFMVLLQYAGGTAGWDYASACAPSEPVASLNGCRNPAWQEDDRDTVVP